MPPPQPLVPPVVGNLCVGLQVPKQWLVFCQVSLGKAFPGITVQKSNEGLMETNALLCCGGAISRGNQGSLVHITLTKALLDLRFQDFSTNHSLGCPFVCLLRFIRPVGA